MVNLRLKFLMSEFLMSGPATVVYTRRGGREKDGGEVSSSETPLTAGNPYQQAHKGWAHNGVIQRNRLTICRRRYRIDTPASGDIVWSRLL